MFNRIQEWSQAIWAWAFLCGYSLFYYYFNLFTCYIIGLFILSISSNILSSLFSLFFWYSHYTHAGVFKWCLTLFWDSIYFSSYFLFSLFFILYKLYWYTSFTNVFSASPDLLLNSCSEFFYFSYYTFQFRISICFSF